MKKIIYTFIFLILFSQLFYGEEINYDWDKYGKWITLGGYGKAWRPKVNESWRPYYYGHWEYDKGYGLIWNSYEPWGWVTYHYGSWVYLENSNEWVWVPDTTWHPGRVVWTKSSDKIAWAPLGPDKKPYFSGKTKTLKLMNRGCTVIDLNCKTKKYFNVEDIAPKNKSYGKVIKSKSDDFFLNKFFTEYDFYLKNYIFEDIVDFHIGSYFFKKLENEAESFVENKNKYYKKVFPKYFQSTEYPFPVHFPEYFTEPEIPQKGKITGEGTR